VPLNFWDDEHNRVRYAEWLAGELGYETAADWHQLTVVAVREHSGYGLLLGYYDGNLQRFVNEVVGKHIHPGHQWHPWLFSSVPQNFWDKTPNRVQYAKWLGAELGYRSAASWDQLNVDAVREHSGWGLLATYYGGSPRRFMKELVFEHLHPEPT